MFNLVSSSYKTYFVLLRAGIWMGDLHKWGFWMAKSTKFTHCWNELLTDGMSETSLLIILRQFAKCFNQMVILHRIKANKNCMSCLCICWLLWHFSHEVNNYPYLGENERWFSVIFTFKISKQFPCEFHYVILSVFIGCVRRMYWLGILPNSCGH